MKALLRPEKLRMAVLAVSSNLVSSSLGHQDPWRRPPQFLALQVGALLSGPREASSGTAAAADFWRCRTEDRKTASLGCVKPAKGKAAQDS